MQDSIGSVTPEARVLVDILLLKFNQMVAILQEMDDESANAELPMDGSNSVVQMVVHCCGAMRRWSSTVNLGVEVPRDRDAEFQVCIPVAEVRDLARQTRSSFLRDIGQTDFAAPPMKVPDGRECSWTSSCQGVLLHVLEEVSQHLGHAEITRDALRAGLTAAESRARWQDAPSPKNVQ